MLLESIFSENCYVQMHEELTGDELGLEVRDEDGVAALWLNAYDRSAIVKHINKVEGRCPANDAPSSAVEDALTLAAERGLKVMFWYQKPSTGVIEQRSLLVGYDGVTTTREGRKIVTGHDPDRDDVRAYRLDRIVGAVRVIAR